VSKGDKQLVTIVVDGTEIEVSEGQMLVDAAQSGDIEIPVFCYEPKLGEPVGACRMCLVEIEGIPKLQTACSTPVRDGMVVYTKTDRVKEAQNAVVEFLLVNHPLDCPVCDKGGECPLQDISMGWGPGKSRVSDPKRHFQKPIPLSPLIRIDRERCILCYRCVRFSQEVSEDEQLQLVERGPKTFVGTHEDRPYVAPFHGNIIELCPVGALTSQSYRFRARPWDIEDAGSVCTLCPSQCNVKYTVRDEKVMRVLARDNVEVDDGWLCDKGRFGYEMFASAERVLSPRIGGGGSHEPASWEEALERSAAGLTNAHGKVGVLVGGGSSNEEGWLLQRFLRGPLASTDIAASPRAGLAAATHRRLADPGLAVATSELDDADAIVVVGTDPMQEIPVLELRIRKAVRRSGAKLLIASERPTALDGGAAIDSSGALEAARYAPGEGAGFLAGLAAELGRDPEEGDFTAPLRDAERVVVVYGERLAAGPKGERGAAALLEVAERLGLAGKAGSGLYEVPSSANGRGLREVGAAERVGPGLRDAVGRGPEQIRDALITGELEALVLWDVDPVREFPDGDAWKEAISAADFTLAVSMFANESTAGANVVLPAETHAEKEGTVTHPDGRLQRVRPSVPRPGAVRPLWQVLSELGAALGDDPGAGTAGEVFDLLAADIPFLNSLDVDKIGGTGLRWQTQEGAPTSLSTPSAEALGDAPDEVEGGPGGASADTQGLRSSESTSGEAATGGASAEAPPGPPPEDPPSDDALRLGTYHDLWADYVAERNPSLNFLAPGQTVEISVATAKRLGFGNGSEVEVGAGERSVRARVALRERIPDDVAFLIEGTASDGAGRLAGASWVELAEAVEETEEPAAFGVQRREKVEW
jgi:NADH-quinone oxidoreductase subunit G